MKELIMLRCVGLLVGGAEDEEIQDEAERILLSTTVRVESYSIEARLLGDGSETSEVSLNALLGMALKAFMQNYPSTEDQVAMIAMSTKKPFTVEEFAKFSIWADGTTHDEDDEASYLMLPECLR